MFALFVGICGTASRTGKSANELLAERGINVDHSTIWRWVQRYPVLRQKSCRLSCGDTSVAAVKPSYLRRPDDPSLPFHLPRSWAVLRERQMRSGARVVGEVRFEDSLQVPSVEHDHMIEAFTANGSDQPFDYAVLPWACGCRHDLMNEDAFEGRQIRSEALPLIRRKLKS